MCCSSDKKIILKETIVQGVVDGVWLNGNGAPSDTLGVDTNYYIDLTTNDIYYKDSGTWGTAVGNIQGAAGVDGQSIDHVTLTAGTGAPGTTDTYTIWGDVGETINLGTFTVYNGADGASGTIPSTTTVFNVASVTSTGGVISSTTPTDMQIRTYVTGKMINVWIVGKADITVTGAGNGYFRTLKQFTENFPAVSSAQEQIGVLNYRQLNGASLIGGFNNPGGHIRMSNGGINIHVDFDNLDASANKVEIWGQITLEIA